MYVLSAIFKQYSSNNLVILELRPPGARKFERGGRHIDVGNSPFHIWSSPTTGKGNVPKGWRAGIDRSQFVAGARVPDSHLRRDFPCSLELPIAAHSSLVHIYSAPERVTRNPLILHFSGPYNSEI